MSDPKLEDLCPMHDLGSGLSECAGPWTCNCGEVNNCGSPCLACLAKKLTQMCGEEKPASSWLEDIDLGARLDPCAHCGGRQFCSRREGPGHWIACVNCTASGPLCDSKEEAETGWNRRNMQ